MNITTLDQLDSQLRDHEWQSLSGGVKSSRYYRLPDTTTATTATKASVMAPRDDDDPSFRVFVTIGGQTVRIGDVNAYLGEGYAASLIVAMVNTYADGYYG